MKLLANEKEQVRLSTATLGKTRRKEEHSISRCIPPPPTSMGKKKHWERKNIPLIDSTGLSSEYEMSKRQSDFISRVIKSFSKVQAKFQILQHAGGNTVKTRC